MVNAWEVASAYQQLFNDPSPQAQKLISYMYQTPESISFGVRESLGSAAIKSGWYWDLDEQLLRTHIVAINASKILVVLTAATAQNLQAYQQAYLHGEEVLSWHNRYGKPEILKALEALRLT